MNSGDIEILGQLIESLEETLLKLEEAKGKKNYPLFNKSKQSIFYLHRQIQEILK